MNSRGDKVKKGFTLAELLGVVTILALCCLVIFPAILSTIQKSKQDISEITQNIIFGATNTYINNHFTSYPKIDNETYYITLQEISDEGLLIDLKDAKTNEPIDLSKCVKVDVVNQKYVMEINECEASY